MEEHPTGCHWLVGLQLSCKWATSVRDRGFTDRGDIDIDLINLNYL